MKIIVLNSRTDYARTPISEDCYFNKGKLVSGRLHSLQNNRLGLHFLSLQYIEKSVIQSKIRNIE